jgi:cell division protein FtsI (penicillin-binding protein 3)
MQAMIPVVNGGVMYPLTILKRNPEEPLVGERVIRTETSAAMRQLMRLVVAEGTGKKSDVPGYYVGGKTGTAEKAVGGKYDKNRRISSFFGIIPASNPKYILYVVLDEPKGIKETFGFAGGGWTAAPVVGRVFERMVTLYGMKKPHEQSQEVQDLVNVEVRIKNET